MKREELAGVRVDRCELPEALRAVRTYLNSDGLNVVETINMKTILTAGGDEKVRACLAEMDLVIPSDREILVEMGITDEDTLREAEDNEILHELLRQARDGQMGIYLLTRTEEEQSLLAGYLKEIYGEELMICGGSVFEEYSEDHDVVNHINAVIPHIILAMLPTPMQEHFIYEHRQMLNAKLWFGIGTENDPLESRSNLGQLYRRLLVRRQMKRQIQSYATDAPED